MKQCFVVAPFGRVGTDARKRADLLLEAIIRPALKRCGYEAQRGDGLHELGLVTTTLIRHLRDDPLVVADLTNQNPNVFYEVAIRHVIGKPIVHLIDVNHDIPFDLAGTKVVEIDHSSPTAIAKSVATLRAHVRALDRSDPKADNPVTAVFGADPLGLLSKRIEGKRLFEHEGFYPVLFAKGKPVLDRSALERAIRHFLKRRDRLAVTDLVYLIVENASDVRSLLGPQSYKEYSRLLNKYDLWDFAINLKEQTSLRFAPFIRLVDDLGDTLLGACTEIVLHDVRNPLKSIIAARNTEGISDRRVGDPSTRFVVHYIQDQGRQLFRAMREGRMVAYKKSFTRDRDVKATTIPIEDPQLGLIGILCINIDLQALSKMDDSARTAFVQQFARVTGKTPQFEIGSTAPKPGGS